MSPVTMARPEPVEPTLAQLTKSYADQMQCWLARIDHQDLLDELAEAEVPLTAALQTGDAVLVGKVVLAIRKSYAERLMQHHEGWDIKTQSASETATAVLAGVRQ